MNGDQNLYVFPSAWYGDGWFLGMPYILVNGHAFSTEVWLLCWHIHAGHLFIFLLFLGLDWCGVKGLTPQILSPEFLLLNEKYHRNPVYDDGKSSCLSFVENSGSCEDLKGVGSLDGTCVLNSSLHLDDDLCIFGKGNVEILPHVSIICPVKGCSVTINVSGNIKVGAYARVFSGSISFDATNITLDNHSTINTTSLGGPPPAQTSGTPIGHDGAGGGHGGRGASCIKSNKTNWGGDVYAWSSLSEPWSYGSKGGSTSAEKQYGGDGGGRIMLKVKDSLQVDGYVCAEGGNGGYGGGGGSGGSIMVHALKL